MLAEINTATDWVRAWYAAPCKLPAAQLSGRTLRQIVHMHIGGRQLRLHLSNRYGDTPVTLRSVSIGIVHQGPVLRARGQPVLFQGQADITLEPGQERTSDPLPLQVTPPADLAITFFLAQGECVSGHFTAQQTSYISGADDVTGASPERAFMLYPLITTSWWLISGVDVLPADPINTVVAFGSSTTDGVGSTPDANRRWTDYLAHRLNRPNEIPHTSVINAGISGNQLTSSEIPRPQGSWLPGFLFGEAGLTRKSWDIMAQPGATDLIIHIGSNDLRCNVTGETLIKALQQLAREAHISYRKVFGTTILPGGYTPAQRKQRHMVNTWIVEQGKRYFDAVFDFAEPLHAFDNEDTLHPDYDSGDGIHPNDQGYQRMAATVDINQLTGNSLQVASAVRTKSGTIS